MTSLRFSIVAIAYLHCDADFDLRDIRSVVIALLVPVGQKQIQ
jgi:hypothetical protein